MNLNTNTNINSSHRESDVFLESERLYIRRFKADDWQDLYEYLSLQSVVQYEPYDIHTVEECKIKAQNRATNEAIWAVCLKENDKLIGNMYFNRQEPLEYLTWEIGFVFNPNFSKKGYATEATRLILKYGFESLGARRIMARCNPLNNPSWQLMERVNMKREGHFRKPAFFKTDSDGKPIWHDAYQYAILDEDYFV